MEVKLTQPDGSVSEKTFSGGYKVFDLGDYQAHVQDYRAKHGVSIGQRALLGIYFPGNFSGVPLDVGASFIYTRKGYMLEVTKTA